MATNLPFAKSHDFIRIARDSAKALRELKKVNPKDRYVLLYPDSEKAHVGMGFKLLGCPPAEEVYAKANDLVKKDLLRLCLDGPKSALIDSYENQQLAAFVTSHATMTKFAHEQPTAVKYCKAAGGIGVGFVNSLVFSGSMSFENGIDLVQRRAQAMERAAQIAPNAKVRIRLRPATPKDKVCRAAIEECIKLRIPEELAVCAVTKCDRPQVIEVAGHEEAIKYLEREGHHLFEFKSIKRVLRNPYAYHSELMRPASDFIRGYINKRLADDPDYLKDPDSCSVYSATSGERLRTSKDIIPDLYKHPIRSIKVEQLLHKLFSRPQKLAQPNILVIWDKHLMETLSLNNRKAGASAKLLEA